MAWEAVGVLATIGLGLIAAFFALIKYNLATIIKNQERVNMELADRIGRNENELRKAIEKFSDAVMVLEKAITRLDASTNRYVTVENCHGYHRITEDKVEKALDNLENRINHQIEQILDRNL